MNLDGLFKEKKLDPTKICCHSGGASGSDTEFEIYLEKFGIPTRAYSWKTNYHQSHNKVEITKEDYDEGVTEIKKANKILKRWGVERYMNLLARNWAQVKYSDQVIAIGRILNPGEKGSKGYKNISSMPIVDGGTGYAVTMAILNKRIVNVFDQYRGKWYRWSYTTDNFIECDLPTIVCENFAGIGTREINELGKDAIKNICDKSFNFISL